MARFATTFSSVGTGSADDDSASALATYASAVANGTAKDSADDDSASALATYASAVANGTAKDSKESLRALLKKDGVAEAGVDALLNDELIDMARRYIDGADVANPKEKPSLWKKAILSLKG